MELIPGVTKEDYSDYVLYYIENFSDELKSEIRSRLVSICHGAEHAQSTRVIYSYKYTLKEFIKSFNRFLIISLDVLICRYSPLFRAFPALFISEEPHKSFYYPSCFRSQK